MLSDYLGEYKSYILDYSVLRQFGGTSVFAELLDLIATNSIDVYVSKAFKLQHYCVIHQADSKDEGTSTAMREICSMLLPLKKLHSVQHTNTIDFLNSVSQVPDSIIITTRDGIFTKRLYEKRPDINLKICVISMKEVKVFDSIAQMIEQYSLPEISPLAFKNNYLDSQAYCNVGDIVTTGKNTSLELTKRVSAGAEGMVFLTNNKNIVAKIYHKGVITPLRWSKLTKMVSMRITCAGICWPQDLIFFRGIPVGYTMFLAKGKTLGNVFDGPDAIMNNFPEWKREDVVSTLIVLLEKYLYLHMHNIVAGDIQLKNALLYSSNAIYLIDMDSVQVGNLPCPVGTEEFTDSALWGKNFASFLRELKDEDYSIAMLVFSILFCGLHPYATRMGAETLREEIEQKNFPYDLENSSDEHIPRGGYNYIWEYLPDYLRTMLFNTFKNGIKYEAIEWYDAVVTYKEELTTHKFTDEEAYKVFPKMDYHATAEADTPIPGNRESVSPGVKRRFSGLDSAAVYHPGPFEKVANPDNVNTAEVARPRGQYVPKAQGSIPTQNTPKPEEPKKKRFGGLFG